MENLWKLKLKLLKNFLHYFSIRWWKLVVEKVISINLFNCFICLNVLIDIFLWIERYFNMLLNFLLSFVNSLVIFKFWSFTWNLCRNSLISQKNWIILFGYVKISIDWISLNFGLALVIVNFGFIMKNIYTISYSVMGYCENYSIIMFILIKIHFLGHMCENQSVVHVFFTVKICHSLM